MKKVFDAIIIGAGPAGIAAAIQMKRYGINFLLFDKNEAGGLLKNASLVENYPGFPKGIKGKPLISLFRKHLKLLGIEIKKENVIDVKREQNNYKVISEKKNYLTRNLVVASGTKPVVYKPAESLKKNFYYEIHELEGVKNKQISVIGGGDAAFDYAYSLSKNRNKVNILMRGCNPGCIPALLEKVSKTENIKIVKNIKIEKAEESRNKIIVRGKLNSREKIYESDILIAAIGRVPEISFIKSISKKECNALRKNSLYFAGDVKNKIYRQAGISIGDGIRAAMEIYGKIKNEDKS